MNDAAVNASAKQRSATYTAADIAAQLQISTRQVWRMRDAGIIPAPITIGRLVRWNASVIDEWVRGGCKPARRSIRV
jgi:predicted DNA-binding transcriptional regulator AlpA